MDRKAKFVWTDKPAIYLVRDQLDKKNCDVVIGLDTGDERVLTSKPYYRAPYVFILRADSKLDITSWDSEDLKKAERIGMAQDSPAQVMLEKLGLFNRNFNYMKSLIGFKSKRNQYVRVPPDRLVGDVADGKADFAVGFAPEVARYAKAARRRAEAGRHSRQRHARRRTASAVPLRPVDRRPQGRRAAARRHQYRAGEGAAGNREHPEGRRHSSGRTREDPRGTSRMMKLTKWMLAGAAVALIPLAAVALEPFRHTITGDVLDLETAPKEGRRYGGREEVPRDGRQSVQRG